MTKLTSLFLLGLLGLLGCTDEKVENTTEQQDHFENDTSVRIAFPENGAVVEDSFYLQYASGTSIAHLELWMDGTFNKALNKTETETLIHLEEGPHTISLKALDNDATLLNEHSITVTVPTEYWVTITAPADGSTVMNPVQFSVSSSDNIDSVEIFSDDWSRP